ncbi:MAG: hypothetical protein ACK56I_26905, partial [bacterium]
MRRNLHRFLTCRVLSYRSLLQPVHDRPNTMQRMFVISSVFSLMLGHCRLEVVVVGLFSQFLQDLGPDTLR